MEWVPFSDSGDHLEDCVNKLVVTIDALEKKRAFLGLLGPILIVGAVVGGIDVQ